MLRTSDTRLLLVDAATPERAARDPRSIALSHGSRELLEQIGAWPAAVTPIGHIHVSQRGHFGHVQLHHEDYGVPALGYVVRYGDLCAALEDALGHAAAATSGQLARAFDTRIEHVAHIGEPAQGDERAGDGPRDINGYVSLRGTTASGTPAAFDADLAVQAEGGLFRREGSAGGSGKGKASTAVTRGTSRQRDYGQTAIVAHVHCTHPRSGWAWERFTPEGPLALLPHDDGFALVWCCAPEQAARRLALPEAAFLAELGEAFGDRMGRFDAVGARHAFPLGLQATPVTVDNRIAVIGNAAQTLHPVAGQGLNLGLRDAFSLAADLRAARSPDALAAFAARHRLDRAVTIGVTDLLPRIFGIGYPLAAHARGASLAALACLGPVKDALARQMMYGVRR